MGISAGFATIWQIRRYKRFIIYCNYFQQRIRGYFQTSTSALGMISLLKNHPFAVEAFFDYSFVLTYAFQKKDLQPLILDTYLDRWAFVAVALVQTKALRPKDFPAFLGNDFFLMGYRIFVRYITPTGKRLRGLYILKSETDS